MIIEKMEKMTTNQIADLKACLARYFRILNCRRKLYIKP